MSTLVKGMKAKRKVVRKSARVARPVARKVKVVKPARGSPLRRKSDAIADRIGFTGSRGGARSATSGIP